MAANPKTVANKVAGEATTAASTAASAPFDPTKAKVLKHVTVPLHKLRAGDEVYFKVTKPIEQAKPMKEGRGKDENKTPPHLLQGINLLTGEVEQIIVGATLLDVFQDEYPSNAYVGRGFHIKVGEQKAAQGGGGKRYNTYSVTEIELPSG